MTAKTPILAPTGAAAESSKRNHRPLLDSPSAALLTAHGPGSRPSPQKGGSLDTPTSGESENQQPAREGGRSDDSGPGKSEKTIRIRFPTPARPSARRQPSAAARPALGSPSLPPATCRV